MRNFRFLFCALLFSNCILAQEVEVTESPPNFDPVVTEEGKSKKSKKIGLWKVYHDSYLHSEGHYRRGEKNGIWKYYKPNKQLRKLSEYKNGILLKSTYYSESGDVFSINKYHGNGRQEEYYNKNGNIESYKEYEGTWKKIGVWKYFNNNGTTHLLEKYSEGKLILSKRYHLNGKLASISEYLNEKLNGQTDYWSNGNLKFEAKYDSNIKKESHVYYENGQIKESREYKNGKFYNSLGSFDQKGKPLNTGSFRNGTGLYKEYDLNGELKFESFFQDGKLIDVKRIEKVE